VIYLDTFGDLNQLAEGGCIMPSKVGKGLAVDVDIGFVQTIDKLAVGHIVQTASGINSGNPQAAELSFSLFSADEGKDHTAFNCLPGYTISFTAGTEIATGGFEIALSSAMGCYIVC